MTQYEHGLHALKRLLDAVGETHWANWVGGGIVQWQTARNTSHHLSAYGGMGSFNDLVICTVNKHSVSPAQEPWANELFDWLKALCYFFAKEPNGLYTADALAAAIGKHDAGLAGFAEGSASPPNIHGYASETINLSGSRCLQCGYGEISPQDIDVFIAKAVVPAAVFDACERLELIKLVDDVLDWRIPNLEELRDDVATVATASGLKIVERDGWTPRCADCDSDTTVVYRWQLVGTDEMRFEPSSNNLPMQG